MTDYMIARFAEIDAVRCPYGFSQQAFVSPDNEKSKITLAIPAGKNYNCDELLSEQIKVKVQRCTNLQL